MPSLYYEPYVSKKSQRIIAKCEEAIKWANRDIYKQIALKTECQHELIALLNKL